MYRPRREDPFLHDPAARVERCVLDAVVPKIVFHQLEIVMRQRPLGVRREADGNRLPARATRPLGKETAGGINVVACGQTQVCVTVDIGHGACFRSPVGGRVLDDAEGVNPEERDGHGAGGGDGVHEGLREGADGNAGGEEGGSCQFQELDRLKGAPAVREDVVGAADGSGGGGGGSFDEVDVCVTWLIDAEEAGGVAETERCGRTTGWVRRDAVLDPGVEVLKFACGC